MRRRWSFKNALLASGNTVNMSPLALIGFCSLLVLALASYWRGRVVRQEQNTLTYFGAALALGELVRAGLEPLIPDISANMLVADRIPLHLDHLAYFTMAWAVPIVSAKVTDCKTGLVVALLAPALIVITCMIGFPLGSKFHWVLTASQIMGAATSWACFARAVRGKILIPNRVHLAVLILVAQDTVLGLYSMLNRSMTGLEALLGEWDVNRLGNIIALLAASAVLLYDRRVASLR